MQILDLVPTYVSARVHPDSLPRLIRLYTLPEFREVRPLQVHDLHVTIINSVTQVAEPHLLALVTRPQDTLKATITGPLVLGKWVTLALESADLAARNKRYQQLGFVDRHPEYKPHLSFAKTTGTASLMRALEMFNGIEISLTGEHVTAGRP